MLEEPAKNTAPGFGGFAANRFSMATMFFSHLANGSTTRGGGATSTGGANNRKRVNMGCS